jgi:hypothetical protein
MLQTATPAGAEVLAEGFNPILGRLQNLDGIAFIKLFAQTPVFETHQLTWKRAMYEHNLVVNSRHPATIVTQVVNPQVVNPNLYRILGDSFSASTCHLPSHIWKMKNRHWGRLHPYFGPSWAVHRIVCRHPYCITQSAP